MKYKLGDLVMCRLGESKMICRIGSFEGEFFRFTKAIVNFEDGWVKTSEFVGGNNKERQKYIIRHVNEAEFELYCTFHPSL